ncbi:hypothetical protein MFIFM68171_05602 [Madurella fahalii]|uniref:Lectin n=1 Tax=Madurella fahalii TaxID=1157608 RepID=A0ABQ0GCB0_9PEZI
MSYTIKIRIDNDSGEEFELVEQTCWWGHNTIWKHTESGHTLSMAASGTSGMLRFRNEQGAYFVVAVGVHNYKRWCDVAAVDDNKPLTELHKKYYDDKDAENKKLWAQQSGAVATLADGKVVELEFYQHEGHALLAKLRYA